MAESYPMKGGDADYSYYKNSFFQREAINTAKRLIDETIAHNLNIKDLLFGSSSSFNIADLGCSVGPNTFICSEIISAPESEIFCCWLCPVSATAVLFPRSSVLSFILPTAVTLAISGICHPSLSPAWNKGRIFYTNASAEVCKAYATQFAKDMEIFLDARAKELVVGGIIVIMVPTIPNGISHSCESFNLLFDLLGSILMDMAKEGLVSEAQVDSFNLPMYIPHAKEMIELVERNRCFNIERIESYKFLSGFDVLNDGQALTKHFRAGLEGIISQNFGSGILDELFDRFLKKTQELSSQLQASLAETSQVFLALKRA
ncbi:loganic acid O-methyltransferase-like [Jatropha curcas]|uniref:loganic acid O-methyltransferase-like n=1 Tax=Jatropha curcas TaxID=180498 RepID=UPI0018946116|nr:loganic acid O-methyltransferase-like [Jatropha curcas]